MKCYLKRVSSLPSRSTKSLKTLLEFVRFEHTLFALPFAYGGMLLAQRGWPGWSTFFWVTVAMVGARTASMALNRVIDAEIDARNPRTANRAIPTGLLSKSDGLWLALFGFILFVLAGWQLNTLTLLLLPVAVFFLTFYPYTKRFTWLCHFWLGLSIGAAAAGGWIAVTGSFAPASIALWLGVGLWIAGFDIIYAILDFGFDCKHGIKSIPARFGLKQALRISALAHLLAWLALAAVLPFSGSSWPYALALLLVGSILFTAHYLVHKKGVGAALASFNANLYISSVMLLGIILDILLG
jgi:4-hydroxybenzoate polyprenyltransferase